MKTKYLCCKGTFDVFEVLHQADSATAAVAWLETHGGGVFVNNERHFKMYIGGELK